MSVWVVRESSEHNIGELYTQEKHCTTNEKKLFFFFAISCTPVHKKYNYFLNSAIIAIIISALEKSSIFWKDFAICIGKCKKHRTLAFTPENYITIKKIT